MGRGSLVRLVLAVLAACGRDDEPNPGVAREEPAPSAESDGESESADECGAASRLDAWVPGISKQSSDVEVRIVEAAPAPPAKGMNELMLAVRDAQGPLDGATIHIKPFMPDHGHGSSWTPVIRSLGGGNYKVEKVQLPMAGRWTLLVEVQRADRAPEHVTYSFCIDG